MRYILIALIPFLGTIIGSAFVFIFKNNISRNLNKVMNGFASGVMLASAIFSLLIPSLEFSENLGKFNFIPSIVGFFFGIMLFILIDIIISKRKEQKYMMPLVVTLHNIPEGLAVGVALATTITSNSVLSYMSVLTLSIGIAIQNIPEGAIISLTENTRGSTKLKSFIKGVLSGIVEPISTFITLIFTKVISFILPYSLSFASGAMIYVIVEELLPSAYDKDSKVLIIAFTIGFEVMMILDIVFG